LQLDSIANDKFANRLSLVTPEGVIIEALVYPKMEGKVWYGMAHGIVYGMAHGIVYGMVYGMENAVWCMVWYGKILVGNCNIKSQHDVNIYCHWISILCMCHVRTPSVLRCHNAIRCDVM
jgi:hypothetical protein